MDSTLSPTTTPETDSAEALLDFIDSHPTNPENRIDFSAIDIEELLFDPTEWLVHTDPNEKMRAPKLYEFLVLLLNNQSYSAYASWVDKEEGIFEIHNPTQVVKLWEKVKSRKTKQKMNFDTFSRGIRMYYARGDMIPTYTRYTYRFASMK
ncbi:unnamed protein product [Adineta ricciae]|uniref:ETS domain-containing protein n=1 Tax=Adineta ricciae TaxID=249248 RepID=A0A813MJQ4_ADIRI|nr:unnamed protein product [Adineta ricciae]CAF1024611.1 unnamed protein product [Adineta ricciae]